MGARVLHVTDVADDFGTQLDAGKTNIRRAQACSVSTHITRSDKEQRRAVFCELVKPRGRKARIAAAWEMNEKTVRRVCEGELLLSDEKIASLPADLRAAFEARMAAGAIQLRLGGL